MPAAQADLFLPRISRIGTDQGSDGVLTADRADERGYEEVIPNVRRIQNLTQRLKAPQRAGS
jgi:hypothetical protein